MPMETFLLQLVASSPAAAACIIVTIYFLKFLKSEREERRLTYDARHSEFFKELERGRELANQVRETVHENTKQAVRNTVAMEQATVLLKKMNGPT